jgi:PKD repeat protein
MSDLESDDNVDVVAYILNLYTSIDSYTIYYVNNKCQITYESTSETENISDFSIDSSGSVLEIPFDLLDESETYNTMEAVSYYIKIPDLAGDEDPSTLPETDYQQLIDMVPDVVLDVTIDAPSEGNVDEDIDFSGEADGGLSPYTWSWDFGDAATSTVQNPTHRYAENGTYEVTLYVTDSEGNQGVDYFTVDVSDSEPSDGGNQDGDTGSSNSGLILFVVVIAVILIAGIGIVIYIIRR